MGSLADLTHRLSFSSAPNVVLPSITTAIASCRDAWMILAIGDCDCAGTVSYVSVVYSVVGALLFRRLIGCGANAGDRSEMQEQLITALEPATSENPGFNAQTAFGTAKILFRCS